jgi:putative GTP pyrophosphokinase
MASASERKLVREILTAYDESLTVVGTFQKQLISALDGSDTLADCIHSIKTRIKDRDHLRDKLYRKIADCNLDGKAFKVTPQNLLTTVNDIAGVRLLHLYTHQIRDIDTALRAVFDEYRYELLEPPFARTWDDESRAFFESCGIETQDSPTLYTSVHYVIGSASQTQVTCEIQVRTLSEEVWGEVEHTINYPTPCGVLACEEQLKVLARVTSSATRLVDSIFLTHAEAQKAAAKTAAKRAATRRKRKASS